MSSAEEKNTKNTQANSVKDKHSDINSFIWFILNLRQDIVAINILCKFGHGHCKFEVFVVYKMIIIHHCFQKKGIWC